MRKAVFTLFMLPVLMMFTATSSAESKGVQLARSNSCLACHQVDQKRVGPAFTAIAQRFIEIEGNTELLVNAITNGSRGKWGAIPMPAQPRVKAGDAHLISAWILSLADKPK